MIGNLTGRQILLIVIIIIIIIWLLGWLFYKPTSTQTTQVSHLGQLQPNITQINTAPMPVMSNSVGQENLVANTPFILYYFYKQSCPYCKKFSSAWNEVSNKLKGINGLSVRAIDATNPENDNLAFYYNITGYPTVILVTPDKNVEYTGDRSAEDLYNFVISILNEYSQNNQYPQNY